MKVFKFGGASVKSAQNIENVAKIIRSFPGEKIIIVVSAMGSTTDALEDILDAYHAGHDHTTKLNEVKAYHAGIAASLFPKESNAPALIAAACDETSAALKNKSDHDIVYDQVVSQGEIISSLMLYHYLASQGISSSWQDARDYIATDTTHREGKINWPVTEQNMQKIPTLFGSYDVIITQGFIGRSPVGFTTTLGREGSDFTAAIFASCLNAVSLTVWKDVPGLMNADPKRLPDAVVLKELPYSEAAEMMYYGANLIHTKTIRPLANKNIPLLVKSFIDPSLPGSRIHDCHIDQLPVMYVFKDDQCLVSVKGKDYAFISEQHLQEIFTMLNALQIRFNMVQHSAISFSFCFDHHHEKLQQLLSRLKPGFEVYYNLNLTLITIKNYTPAVYEEYRHKKDILMEQSSRSTLQVLLK